MSAPKYAKKVDLVQTEIVEGLRAAGWRVQIIGQPVDLLVGRKYASGSQVEWQLLEIKTPTKTGARRSRRDQEAQDAFIRETGTPVVTSLSSALRALEAL